MRTEERNVGVGAEATELDAVRHEEHMGKNRSCNQVDRGGRGRQLGAGAS